jgi:hypothetical protein
MARLIGVLLLLAELAGCSGMTSRPWFGSDPQGYWLPLRVNMKLDPSVTGASLDYTNGCQEAVTVPIGGRLTTAFSREIGMVFEKVQTGTGAAGSGPSGTFDGEVQVSLGLKELELYIPRRETNSYDATVILGGTVTYTDTSGATLFSKKLRTEAKGKVETDRDQCAVRGLTEIANEAATKLAQGFKKNLGESVKIRQAARSPRGDSRQPLAGSRTGETAVASASSVPTPVQSQAPPQAAGFTGSPVLSFRAMLKDESLDQVLEGGEQVIVKVEVKNTSGEVVKGVVVDLGGSPSLVQMLAGQIPVGDLQPGESKQVEAKGRVPPVSAVQQAELIVSVLIPSASGGQPSPKKFIAALRPAKLQNVEVLSVDVDQVPQPVRGFERRKAVGIAIGIGSFRNADVPGVKYAARDAKVMAEYFRTVGGIPAKQVKLITDDHALKQDLAEVFEEWLPQQVESGSLVMIFFSGRAVVDPATGSVMLLPYESSPDAPARSFSLRRLQTELARLPIQQAVLLLDVALMTPSAAVQPNVKGPVWLPHDQAGGKVVQLLGVNKVQEAHRYDLGKHGLFTYYLLKGLAGAADRDQNGFVALGELYDYARTQVSKTAQAEYGNEQEPACVPALAPTSKAWHLPLARIQ